MCGACLTQFGRTCAGIRICSGTAPIRLHGINWFGFETGATFVDGLYQGPSSATLDFINVLRRIKLLGFNTIRLPMSLKVRRLLQLAWMMPLQ